MSQLKTRIAENTKDAMRARDKARLGVLRLINSEIKRIEVDERRELDDSDVLTVLNRMLKQRKDSERQFRDADRTDLAEQEAFEIGIVCEFMPQPLSAEALDDLIKSAISDSGADSMKDMGKVMGIVKAKAAGKADMSLVSNRVKALLSG